jgi:prepilin-type N-terminal cleavage/methylation domain-containing protein
MKKRNEKGFTLVELLVVMGIMAVLIGISVAGLGFAMRRSRNIARSAAMSNLDKALQAHYADDQTYPDDGNAIDEIIGETGNMTPPPLEEYLEGTWDAGAPGTTFCYRTDNANVKYSICVSQEQGDGTDNFQCTGPGVGQSGWPSKEVSGDCTNCGTCRVYGPNEEWDNPSS